MPRARRASTVANSVSSGTAGRARGLNAGGALGRGRARGRGKGRGSGRSRGNGAAKAVGRGNGRGRGIGAAKAAAVVAEEPAVPRSDDDHWTVPVAMVAVNGVCPTVDVADLFKLSGSKAPCMDLDNCRLDGVGLDRVNALKKLTARLATLAGVGITVVTTRVNVADVADRKRRIRVCLALLTEGFS